MVLFFVHFFDYFLTWVFAMQSMYFLIPLSLVLLVVVVWAIRYAVRSGQFDDLDNAAEQVILDDKQMRRQQQDGE